MFGNEYEVVGFRAYKGEFEGRKYSGYFVHCLRESAREGFEGRETVEIKVKSKIGYTPHVGDRIIPIYDETGLRDIEVVG